MSRVWLIVESHSLRAYTNQVCADLVADRGNPQDDGDQDEIFGLDNGQAVVKGDAHGSHAERGG